MESDRTDGDITADWVLAGRFIDCLAMDADLRDGTCWRRIAQVGGGLLAQQIDTQLIDDKHLTYPTKRRPTGDELAEMRFAMKVVKHAKSNAVVLSRNRCTVGVGAGQMSRVDSTRIATRKAADAGLALTGAVAASDAFFPFRDGVDVIAAQGIRAIIHPGGSVRDDEIIAAANEHGIAMVFTGIRHFRH